MARAYSSEVCRQLAAMADEAGVLRPRRITRHEAGDVLELDLTGVAPAWKARAAFELERYVGGGFAGQVYRAKLLRLDAEGGAAATVPLAVGGTYAVKIFVPWSRFGRGFRDVLYGIGFQAPFGLQVNPSAVRACALWHKLIRRGAAIRLGSENAVVDVHATFCEPGLGSMGEVLEWIDGRVWLLEVNDRLFAGTDGPLLPDAPPLTEHAAKRAFMRRMVALFHEMGGPELARQYEWWTMKSQPNALKRRGHDDDPAAGLVAVDFGAGLALLPLLPMSPADVVLIGKGLAAGRLVQFDRGDLGQLESFVASHPAEFTDLGGAVAELRMAEARYHGAQLDLANHRLRVLTDGSLRRAACKAWADGYAVRGLMDAAAAERFARRPVRTALFVLLGLLPLVGGFLQRLWGSAVYRRHVGKALTSAGYLARALGLRQAEKLIDWHRRGRVSERRALALMKHPVVFWLQAPTLAFLPAGLHRLLTDRRYALDVLRNVVLRPVRLYFNAALRREWLVEMIEQGRDEGMLRPEEARHILSRVDEPFIQKYLKCLAVHVCTLPVTQIVSGLLAAYYFFFVAQTWEDAVTWSLVILAVFQITPISPGSFVRGAYVVYLMIRERNWYDYRLASVISFWKYIGYLGFPIQMVSSYPVLARFMAARWATQGIRLVPVFGEHGALLEHGFFNLFFNVPISLKRRWEEWAGRNRFMAAIGVAGGIGYLPGPSGTYASAVTAAALAGLFHVGCPWWAVFIVIFPLVAVGIVTAGATEVYLGRKDPRPFVLDEVVGMMIAA
ncbi:MAG: phosphatidylglycerophosphatase A, partial [Planctomycetes bacterium]|nr:phosphatidylglycerophosphatase A [Planctomycetota bacterium]